MGIHYFRPDLLGITAPPSPRVNGVGTHTEVWGKLLASWGYVVVAPDSFAPRGEKSVCGRGNVVNVASRAAYRKEQS